MNRLSKLEITNYRSCIETRMEMTENLTTLVGVNGAGKTNILTAIYLLRILDRRRHYIHDFSSSDKPSSILKFNLKLGSSEYSLKIKFYYETEEKKSDEIYQFDLFYKKPSDKKWNEIDSRLLDYLPHLSQIRPHHQRRLFSKHPLDLIKYLRQASKYFLNISYYSATQFSNPAMCSTSLELEDSKNLPKYGNIKSHDRFIYDLYSTYRSNKKGFQRYLSIVNKEGIGLVDGIDFKDLKLPVSSYEVLSAGKIKKIAKKNILIIPLVKLDGLVLSPNQLSEGTFKTLALIFYILNDKGDLLLIEEPEVCVHHGLLDSIIELIKINSKRKQIIISTHSDYVLDKLKPENIILVTRNKKTGTIAKKLSKALSRSNYKALKKYLGNIGGLGEYWKESGFENEQS